MVAFGLIGVCETELGERLVGFVTGSEVTGDRTCRTRVGVSARKGKSAERGVAPEQRRVAHERDRDLHVSQLAHVELALALAGTPTEEDVAGRLHEVLSGDDTLAVVRDLVLVDV